MLNTDLNRADPPAVDRLDAAALRALRAAHFPYLADRVYLDTAAAGLTWQGHGAAVARFFDAVKSRGIDARPEWLALTQRVRERLARLFGVGADDITFVSNTSEGLNLAAHSLRLRAGDRIVLAADEFPSLMAACRATQRAGAELVPVAVPHEAQREQALLDALDARTRVLAVSQTHWSTGTTLDLQRLAAACRRHGTLLLVDGMQALGAVPCDAGAADVFAASMFKWMLSGFGIGVLVTSARARAAMEPAYRGYANLDDAQRLQYAHVNIPALYGLDATLDLFDRIGWSAVFARVRELGDRTVQVAARLGLPLITPPTQRAGIFVFRCADADAVRTRLGDAGFSVSARGDGIRVSPHFYNSADEVEACLQALAADAAIVHTLAH
jgi:selenocysteine lyase/cysteine desulfurase